MNSMADFFSLYCCVRPCPVGQRLYRSPTECLGASCAPDRQRAENKRRPILRLRGLRIERKEVEDRRILIPLSGPGPHETRMQLWPSLVEQNWTRNIGINDLLVVSDSWSPPSSPASSLGSNPWADYLDDKGDIPD